MKQILAKLRDPNRPGRTLVALGSRNDIWELIEEAEVMKVTEYEKWVQRIGELQSKRDELAEQAKQEEQAYVVALAEGRPTKLIREYSKEIELLEESIEMAKREQQKHLQEHIHHQLELIEQQLDGIKKGIHPYEERVHQAQMELDKAKLELSKVQEKDRSKWNQLMKRREKLLSEMKRIEIEQPFVSEHTEEKWLELLRQGKITTIVTGNDPVFDAAYRRYDQEREEIRSWYRKQRIQSQTTGYNIPSPECVAQWPTRRVAQLREGR